MCFPVAVLNPFILVRYPFGYPLVKVGKLTLYVLQIVEAVIVDNATYLRIEVGGDGLNV